MENPVSKQCSKANAERYLLNRMSSGEETAFQEHLETCKACRTYVNAIRRLSCLTSEEELVYAAPAVEKPAAGKRIRLRTFMSIAACIVLVVGISLYINNQGTSYHETYINTQSKADKAEMRTEMLFPDKEAIRSFADQPVVFLWSKEAEYRLVIRYGNKIIVEVEGYGAYYIPETKLLAGLPEFEWMLNFGDEEFKGRIYLIK